MRRLGLVIFAVLAILAFGVIFRVHLGPTGNSSNKGDVVEYTLELDQQDVHRGDSVTFTGTFPAAAFRQSHNSQFHQNPYLSVFLTDPATGSSVFGLTTSFLKKAKNPDGSFVGQSYPLLLDSQDWPAAAAAVGSATSLYWTDDKEGVIYHFVSGVAVNVAP